MATGDSFSRVELLNGNLDGGAKRLRFESLLVMFRMHFITWVFPSGFDLSFA